jgi:8-oxo-dGTP pyrophosphatase MutT (NUDIX family)
VARELQEEIGADLTNLTYVGVLENIFTYEGHPGHEIVLVYEADLGSPDLYEIQETTGLEDGGGRFKVMWKSLSEFGHGGDPLYPEGLVELLMRD